MRLNRLEITLNCVVPKPDRVVSRCRSNDVAIRADDRIVHRALMSNKAERPKGRLEVPDHHRTVFGTRDYLLEVWVEYD